jgi:hypothetical protein
MFYYYLIYGSYLKYLLVGNGICLYCGVCLMFGCGKSLFEFTNILDALCSSLLCVCLVSFCFIML